MSEQQVTSDIVARSSQLGSEYRPFMSPLLENPYPFYARARREEPIFYSEQLNAWVVTRYDDIRTILLQPELFSSRDTIRPVVEFTPEVIEVMMTGYPPVPATVNSDGIEHMRFRTPLNKAFAPPRMKAMEPVIRTIANRLVDTFIADGHADMMAQFATPLPLEVILLMFDVPQEKMELCKKWSDDFQSLVSQPLPPDRQLACARSLVAFQRYIAELIEARRHKPGDDVVSALLTVHYDEQRPLDMNELVNALTAVLLAGHETTARFIGTALRLLLEEPTRWQQIKERPEVISTVLEEALRFDTPVQTFFRTAMQNTRVGDVTLPEGSLLLLVYGSGNRDEAIFVKPEQFDMQRTPNRHLSFGHGIHFCVGAPLARLEGRVAFEVLSRRLPSLRLQPDQTFTYGSELMFRGLTHLLVEWDADGDGAVQR